MGVAAAAGGAVSGPVLAVGGYPSLAAGGAVAARVVPIVVQGHNRRGAA